MSPLAGLVLCVATFAAGCLTGDAAADRRYRRRLIKARIARRAALDLFWQMHARRDAALARFERARAEGNVLLAQVRAELADARRAIDEAKSA